MTSTKGARALKMLIGLPLILGGVVFTWLLWRSYQLAEETRRWTPVPALIVTSQLITDRVTPNSPISYRADIHYRYTLEGKTYTGHRVKRVEGNSSTLEKPQAQLADYPVGKSATCYVDPAHPDHAVLEHATRAGLYSLWFPLLFVAGGTGIIWSAFRAKS